MGLGLNIINSASAAKPVIDSQALIRVSEQILKPNSEQQAIDVSKLNLSGFHRVQLGTDLYAERTNTYLALEASKAKTSFDVQLSNAASANIQYLNSLAAQTLMASKDKNGQITIAVEAAMETAKNEMVMAYSQVTESQTTDKDKKGQNPFSFYIPIEDDDSKDDNEQQNYNSLNIIA
ncbi:MAG: hypothetical protein ACI37R_06000 [Candidatus Avigastranaerophilus sp.]